MKSLFFGLAVGAALTLVPGHALAADLSRPVMDPGSPCGFGRFQGFYAGGNVGGVSYRADRTDQDAFLGEATSYSATKDGLGIGAQIGYNWQCHNKLFGIEADWQWTGLTAENRLLP